MTLLRCKYRETQKNIRVLKYSDFFVIIKPSIHKNGQEEL